MSDLEKNISRFRRGEFRTPVQDKGVVLAMRSSRETQSGVSEYLKRVEHAARSLAQATDRINKLEETVYDFRQREVNLMAELNQSRMQAQELQVAL